MTFSVEFLAEPAWCALDGGRVAVQDRVVGKPGDLEDLYARAVETSQVTLSTVARSELAEWRAL